MTIQRWTVLDTGTNAYAENFYVDGNHVAATPREWSVSMRRLRGGLSDGVDVINVDTGRIKFTVVPTRGMGLWQAGIDGHRVGWNSPVRGPVHPQFIHVGEPSGLGLLDGTDELMFRCGLESNGAPVFDDGGQLRFPLHGRIANLPAHFVEVAVDAAAGLIFVRGQVEESRFLHQKLRLSVEYSAAFGGASVTWKDRVENIGGVSAKMQMIYHTNIGQPMLESGWQLKAPVAKICPRDDVAATAGMDRWHTYPPPRADSWEQVYFLELIGDAQGDTQVMLQNAAATLGVGLKFNRHELPYFTQWRNTQVAADGYVTGIEPGTNFPNPRSFEERHGRIVNLTPNAAWQSTVSLDVYTAPELVKAAAEAIAGLQRDRPTEVCPQPIADWSPLAS